MAWSIGHAHRGIAALNDRVLSMPAASIRFVHISRVIPKGPDSVDRTLNPATLFILVLMRFTTGEEGKYMIELTDLVTDRVAEVTKYRITGKSSYIILTRNCRVKSPTPHSS